MSSQACMILRELPEDLEKNSFVIRLLKGINSLYLSLEKTRLQKRDLASFRKTEAKDMINIIETTGNLEDCKGRRRMGGKNS